MKFIVLIENSSKNPKHLIPEKGLSIYVETENSKILFDTGRTNKFMANAKRLGVDLQAIDTVILSHWHNDHSGGLQFFLKENSKAIVYMKYSPANKFYFKYGFIKKNIGLDKSIINNFSDRFCFVDKVIEIKKNIFLFPDIYLNSKTISDDHKFFFVEKFEIGGIYYPVLRRFAP